MRRPHCRRGHSLRRTARPTIAHSGLRTRNAGTTSGPQLSTPIGRQPAWRRSPTCGATSSPTGHGWPPTRRWRPGPRPRTWMSFQTGAWIRAGPAATVPGAGGVPRRRRATRLLRLRQHARSTGPEPGDDQGGPRARPPCDRVPRVGRPVTAGQRTRLPVHRRGQTSRRSSSGSPPSYTTAARAPPPRPRRPEHPRSSSPRCTTSTTGQRRVHHLGIGTAHAPGAPTADSLTEALSHTLQPDVAARARAVAASVRTDGAEIAARRLIGEVSRTALGNELRGARCRIRRVEGGVREYDLIAEWYPTDRGRHVGVAEALAVAATLQPTRAF